MIEIFSRNCKNIIKDSKLKSAAKNKTGTILGINKKTLEDEELAHELFLKTRQTTKIKNVFANNMSANIKV